MISKTRNKGKNMEQSNSRRIYADSLRLEVALSGASFQEGNYFFRANYSQGEKNEIRA